MIIKRILIGLAAVVVAILLVVVLAVALVEFGDFKDDAERLASNALGREVTIEGTFEPSLSLHPSILIEGLTIGNAEWAEDDVALTADRVSATVDLWSVVRRSPLIIEEVLLSGVAVNVELRDDGELNWMRLAEGAEENQESTRSGGGVELQTLSLDLAELTVRTPARAENPYAIVVREMDLNSPIGSERLAGSFDASVDSHPLAVTFAVDSAYAPSEVELSLVGADVAGLGELAGVSLPAETELELETTIEFDLASDPQRVSTNDLEVLLGGSDIAGSLSLDFGSTLMITANLASEHFDLGDIIAASPEGEEAPPETSAATGDRIFSDDPASLAALSLVNVSAELSIAELVTNFTEATNIQLSIELRDGDLNVDPLSLDVNGGSVAGRFGLEETDGLATISMGIDGEQIRMTTSAEDDSFGLPPPLDIIVDIRGSGTTTQELALSAAGHVTVIQGAGRRGTNAVGVLANGFIAQLFTALNPFAKEDPYTEFECGVARADFAEGAATLSPLLMRTNKIVIVGDGGIDLATESIDITFNTKPREGIGLAAAGLVTPFMKVGGRLGSPSLGVNATGVAVEGSLAVVTGGLSLLGKEMFDRVTSESATCDDVLEEIGVSAAPPGN